MLKNIYYIHIYIHICIELKQIGSGAYTSRCEQERVLRHSTTTYQSPFLCQVISDVSNASRYILGYAFKSEEDQAAARRMEAIIANLTANNDDNTLNNQQVYKAAHAALQGRTTSTFEACHLLLGYPVVQFSRDNVWIQAGPPATWTIWVPKWDELQALQQPDAYYKAKQRQRESQLPLAQFWYQEFQTSQSEEEVVVPVEGGNPVLQKWKDITFFDFCAGFKFRGCQEPIPRKRPAIVGYRNFNPDLEPEPFYYSRLLLLLGYGQYPLA